jgi:large subunit ribosomal protein L30
MGMINKVKDYVTWGEIKPDTLAKMIIYRGKLMGDKPLSDKYIKSHSDFKSIMSFAKAVSQGMARYQDIKDIKPVIRLHPPKKGFEGVKRSFKAGGALGYRGENINDLIDRMI